MITIYIVAVTIHLVQHFPNQQPANPNNFLKPQRKNKQFHHSPAQQT